ncbi:hypothetical protein DCE79_02630 [Lysinibacillus sp. 2017]|uniref:hypothetical protein n=1 Tax=unclassified Lysinibacillus TaxID=2636778 RepID=UPI000D529E77|nr:MULTISPECIES: hypothetical protein [unclassified Lysinibacillus]AWE06345.1 hypothetical protein DCE79_02630 [Lysinibacillus sp. 2017]TGN35035.1 hypothetical protein E4L99_11770 [Lysinibacillus sp. S2017]
MVILVNKENENVSRTTVFDAQLIKTEADEQSYELLLTFSEAIQATDLYVSFGGDLKVINGFEIGTDEKTMRIQISSEQKISEPTVTITGVEDSSGKTVVIENLPIYIVPVQTAP